MTEKETNTFSFEQAYQRLEKILEQLNTGELSLEKSLELYEEADGLITHCSQKLNTAEQKIQILIKNRNGTLSLDDKEKPKLDEFIPC